ncbi:uncharacterized protein LOC114366201 [Ostrinia furnacalis]|uniref:uncharacterized protein LOC114366201 n=1 Tax=Ostrinia furnacalis TaxID=93504 RepID=UPI001038F6FA|nr:uncharacterized protein LOC114366201 [Ostrinia furnacalis]
MSREADMSVCEDASRADETTPPNYVFERRSKAVTTGDLHSFKEEIKDMIKSLRAAQQQEFKNITPTIMEIKQTNTNIESSIALLMSQNQELSNRILQLENKSKEDREYITLLEEKVENLQMGSRKSNFEIKNVPKKTAETKDELVQMALSLSSSIGGNLCKTDIKDIYRVHGKKDSQTSAIIVETSSTLVKNDILRLCKAFNVKTKAKLCAKHLGLRSKEDTPIFVSEQLTAKGSRLHFLARDLAKSKQYKFCWTAYGKVYVRKADSSPIILIKSEAQIQQLMNTD